MYFFVDNSTICEQDWMAWNGTCLTVIRTASSGYGYGPIQEWRSTCGQKGGRLVTIDTLEKHQFIADLLMGREIPTFMILFCLSLILLIHMICVSLLRNLPSNTYLSIDTYMYMKILKWRYSCSGLLLLKL